MDDPSLLERLGDCYRELNNREEAIRFYKLYLHEAPNAPNRAAVLERIAKLEQPGVKQAPGAPPVPPGVPRPPEKKKPVVQQWWFWTTIGGVVVIGVGLGVGLGLGLSSGPPFNTSLPPFGPTPRAAALGGW
jgi:hypothetical protein